MMRIEIFEEVRSSISIAFKKALVEDSPLYRHLVKHDLEDVDEAFVKAEKYFKLEGI